jgi:hypothetical protein
MEARGELDKGTSSRWAHHTPGGIKKLPEKKKKSAAYDLGQSLAMGKQAGPMAYVGRKAVMPAIKGILGPLQKLLAKIKWGPAQSAGKAVGKYRTGLGDTIAGGLPTAGPGLTTPVGPPEEILKRLRLYGGIGTAAVGIPALAGILGGISGGRRRKAERELDEAMAKGAEHLGTPFMDGFLIKCAQAGLNQKQAVDLLEKAAEKDDRTGKECKAFLERVAACKE